MLFKKIKKNVFFYYFLDKKKKEKKRMNDLFLQSFQNLKIQDESNDIDPSDLYNLDQSIDLQDLIDP